MRQASKLQDASYSERFADDVNTYTVERTVEKYQAVVAKVWRAAWGTDAVNLVCLLYTSDAADE